MSSEPKRLISFRDFISRINEAERIAKNNNKSVSDVIREGLDRRISEEKEDEGVSISNVIDMCREAEELFERRGNIVAEREFASIRRKLMATGQIDNVSNLIFWLDRYKDSLVELDADATAADVQALIDSILYA